MSDLTFSVQDIITLSAAVGAIVALIALAYKPFKAFQQMQADIANITESVNKIDKAVSLHGDMIAELLEHSIDGNNTGKMREVKKRFDDAYRHDLTA